MSKFLRVLTLCLAVTAFDVSLVATASAEEAKSEKKAASDAEAANEKELARAVEMSGLVFPMFDEKGMLKNYMFVNIRMLVADGKDPWKFRERSHFIRDAVLRAAHRKSFNVAGDYMKLDEKVAMAEMLKAGNEAAGEAAFIEVKFTQVASQRTQ
jgi:hypothetical protein